MTDVAFSFTALPTFRRFFGWWFGELGGLLGGDPASTGIGDAVIVEFAGADIVVKRRKGHRVDPIARLGAGSGAADGRAHRRVRRALAGKAPVVLRLAEGDGLSRVVHLPPAAEADLDAIVAFEVGRQTPFPPSEVVHDYAVLGRESSGGRLAVRLAVVPKAAIAAALERLGDWRARPDALELPLGDGGFASLVLDRDARRSDDRRTEWRRNALLAALVVLLAGVLVGIHLDRRAELEADLARRVEQAKAAATAVAALRDEVTAAYGDASFLARAKRRLPAAVTVLDELSRALPDDGWLTRLEIKDDAVEVTGVSVAAAGLVARLDASPMLTDVAFRSPVTRAEDGQRERFHIGARLVGEGGS
ncbi:MAG: PilN domain-containing protein [Alphaproteobacteria bacterium]